MESFTFPLLYIVALSFLVQDSLSNSDTYLLLFHTAFTSRSTKHLLLIYYRTAICPDRIVDSTCHKPFPPLF